MAKKYLVFTLAIMLMLPLSSCTSGGNKEGEETPIQQNDAAFAQEGGGDLAGQGGDNPQNQLQTDGQPVAQDGAKPADLNAPQDAGQDLALDGQTKPGAAGKDELSLDDPQPLPDGLAGADPAPPPGDPGAAPPVEGATGDQAAAPPPTDEPLFKADAGKPEEPPPGGDASAGAESPAPKTFAPLQKIKDAAFDSNGTNLNRVYLVRAGDKSVKAISKKLYGGKDRSKDLKTWNATIARRAPKVGDKVYYQSPTNPEDTQMLTYYDEAGFQPKIYTTQEGDNLRKLATNWLGSKESWKEVWSTNSNVDSKGDVPAGLQLKYWTEDEVAQATPPSETAPPVDQVAPPPPPTEVAQNDLPPPPPPPTPPTPASTPDGGTGAPGTVEPPPPPPPPPVDQAPPPPPPPPAMEGGAPKRPPIAKGAEEADEDQDTTMAMGLGAILLIAAAVLFVVLRRNRAKRVDLGQTQV
jgi:hypothetical protein